MIPITLCSRIIQAGLMLAQLTHAALQAADDGKLPGYKINPLYMNPERVPRFITDFKSKIEKCAHTKSFDFTSPVVAGRRMRECKDCKCCHVYYRLKFQNETNYDLELDFRCVPSCLGCGWRVTPELSFALKEPDANSGYHRVPAQFTLEEILSEILQSFPMYRHYQECSSWLCCGKIGQMNCIAFCKLVEDILNRRTPPANTVNDFVLAVSSKPDATISRGVRRQRSERQKAIEERANRARARSIGSARPPTKQWIDNIRNSRNSDTDESTTTTPTATSDSQSEVSPEVSTVASSLYTVSSDLRPKASDSGELLSRYVHSVESISETPNAEPSDMSEPTTSQSDNQTPDASDSSTGSDQSQSNSTSEPEVQTYTEIIKGYASWALGKLTAPLGLS